MKNVAVIPARGGSKGIFKKNIKMFAGKPLICWTIESLVCSKNVDQIIVSTDDPEIRRVAQNYNVFIRDRAEDISGDNIHAVNVVLDAIESFELNSCDANIGMFLPTAPLRTSSDVINSFGIMRKHDKIDAVIGVTKLDSPISNIRTVSSNIRLENIVDVKNYETQRQNISDSLYVVNGAIFIKNASNLVKTKSFHIGRCFPYIMKKSSSIDINDHDDFEMAEAIMLKRMHNG